MAAGCAGAFYYTLRLAFRNPDVAWIRKEGQISNEEYAAKQYKVRTGTNKTIG